MMPPYRQAAEDAKEYLNELDTNKDSNLVRNLPALVLQRC